MKYLNPKNWYYFIKGYLTKSLIKSSEQELHKYLIDRAAHCSDCAKHDQCIHCGCSTYEMFLSKKPCRNYDK